MERISVFDIFKIGVGPSSSHTMGPWKAAQIFTDLLGDIDVTRLKVHLYGSLSKTGKGHGTDIAVMLGLAGYDYKSLDTTKLNDYVFAIRAAGEIVVNGRAIQFDPSRDIIFEPNYLSYHPNGLTFEALLDNECIISETYFSVGGGFVEKANYDFGDGKEILFPYPIDTADQLMGYTDALDCAISDIVLKNEVSLRDAQQVDIHLDEIFDVMLHCVYNGCITSGTLPGGLNVKRRAMKIANSLLKEPVASPEEMLVQIKSSPLHFNDINRWVSCFALAVNEENAGFGRVVTSPTNGAAGVIPSVLLYYLCFCENSVIEDVKKFMLTAGEVGSLFKKGATISAAVGGCQAEIGVSSAMAAAGLTEVMGGTPLQCLMAAEIAMEHHLGLTCDPVGGLVQIPCIERNSMGAIKAITACNLALSSDPKDAIVKFDTIIETMSDTARDMNSKYKETSEGGLAFKIPVILPNC